jgi:phage tail tape-measure protein
MTVTREERVSDTDPAAGPNRSRVGAGATDARSERTVGTGAGTALALAAGTLARLVRLVAGIVAAIIVAGILLVVLNANPSNDIVSAIHDAARALVAPFDGMFTLDSADATLAVNWGIAAVVYLIVGGLIARLIALIGIAGLRRRHVT